MSPMAEKISTNNILELLTVEELAGKLKVSPRTLRFWSMTGQIPSVRLGRLWRFRQSDLVAFLKHRSNRRGR